MKPPSELPRFTCALRAFADVSPPQTSTKEDSRKLLEKKRYERASEESKNSSVSIQNVKDVVFRSIKGPRSDMEEMFGELSKLVKEFIGTDWPPDMASYAAVYLMQLFWKSAAAGPSEVSRMKRIFGNVTNNQAMRAHRLVSGIVSQLPDPDTAYQQIFQPNELPNDDQQEFGQKIKFCVQGKLDDSEIFMRIEDFEDNQKNDKSFSLQYTSPAEKPEIEVATRRSATPPVSENDKVFNYKWLKKEIKARFGGDSAFITSEEMADSILKLLKSSRNNDELQNELFELLGYENIPLIQNILEHRESISSHSIHLPAEMKEHLAAESAPQEQKPTIACQITVQSEQEKLLRKQLRKDEKRLQRDSSKMSEMPSDVKGSVLNVAEARRRREAELLAASQAPILQRVPSAFQRERYPYVFDSYAEAKGSASFVAGSKLTLPVNHEKKSTSKYEEVTIPPSEKASPPTKKLIPVDSLDEVVQLGFKNVKSLNQIQSFVFDKAYHTNENLLICAPTGAGKTNIAMLTILREIKQHIEGGVLKKEQFKIVYVAPMKALAAEMVRNFGKRLEPFGVMVRELTGDMQLTKTEIMQTQMLVTTPEKWDVVTRKATGDIALAQLVRLLILDEVHLLHGDRGPVLEALVARTIRQVESSQTMIRIVGLSATLPNYIDVAEFLRVNPYQGLFYFDQRFRTVPLGMTFVGIKATSQMEQLEEMDRACYQKVISMVEKGHQVMVFVHSRNATVRTAIALKEEAQRGGQLNLFLPKQCTQYGSAERQMLKSRNKQLRELFSYGFAIHHAGMLRTDRNLVEKYFSEGHIKVLVCTSTLAWGVNLPAHAVIIRGTEIYDSKHGSFVDLGILDVQQIFGRAGRPQFDKTGFGIIITTHTKLPDYLSLLTCQYPIESSFVQNLADHLNAEISLGTVTNVDEAIEWLSYTYLYVRMRKNPLAYGIGYQEAQRDPMLFEHRRKLIINAAQKLDAARMVRYNQRTGSLSATDMGRTASHFYIKNDTIEHYNDILKQQMSQEGILCMVSQAQEFDQLKVREEEIEELIFHKDENCHVNPRGGVENAYGKVNILLQTYLSRGHIDSFSLVSDQAYVVQNAARIIRALFEMCLQKNWAIMAGRILRMSKCVERQMWDFEHPLRQFSDIRYDVMEKVEEKQLTIDVLKEMDWKEIGNLVRHLHMGKTLKLLVKQIPSVEVEPTVQPITRTVLRVSLKIIPDFYWNDKVHGKSSEPFWIWVSDPENDYIYHYEYFLLARKHVKNNDPQVIVFTIPISEPLPVQYLVHIVSDRWLGSEIVTPLSFKHLILPEHHCPHTELLDLDPLPVTALQNVQFEMLYNFTHFNPIQTQIFHTLYHTDYNVLLGAPTGSGKTIAAEIAMFRIFTIYPGTKVVYIAPLKALVRERIEDWKHRLEEKLGKHVVELTGDVMPDMRSIATADVIVTTPEKWDGVSRSWQTRMYVRDVSLIVIDEIHLLGEDRGPVLEVIVSRTKFITAHTGQNLRIIGLSTALANAKDLANWLGIGMLGLYNFRPSVRPVPLSVHVSGYPGKHYCPRMALMNKPAYQAIQTYSPTKPILIFVSSRRQTRLTALDLIAFLAAEDNPRQFVHLEEGELDCILQNIKDQNLKLTLAFGIGLHHAGLQERDRRIVEELFLNQKIQVLIATATLAWGVNLPAHLVIVKGTEYYDGKTQKYVDFPITDVLQMIGRAGRPQFDDSGVAVVLVHDIKKDFYKKFLYEPFPVESSLLEVLPDHLNAEIVAGTITTKQNCLDYITWTYLFRRLIQNPTYYGLTDTEPAVLNKYLSALVDRALGTLERASCIEIEEDCHTIQPTVLGRIASFYYLNYRSVQMFREELTTETSLDRLLEIMTNSHEYAELPVRHNEDMLNKDLSQSCPLPVNQMTFDSPHTKAHLLLQAHFSRLALPCSDYLTDLKSVLDQAIRIIQAMIDVTADQGWLATTLRIISLLQMVLQGRWFQDSTLLTLPHIELHHLYCFKRNNQRIQTLPELMHLVQGSYEKLAGMLRQDLEEGQIEKIYQTITALPVIGVSLRVIRADKSTELDVILQPKKDLKDPVWWIPVGAEEECTLRIDLTRLRKRSKEDTKAVAPKFPKQKDEGWFLVLGMVEKRELLALKRIGFVSYRSWQQLCFYTPEIAGRYIYTLYIMSDSYLGLDQQYDIHLEVSESNL